MAVAAYLDKYFECESGILYLSCTVISYSCTILGVEYLPLELQRCVTELRVSEAELRGV